MFDHTRTMHARENMWGYRASHGPGIVPWRRNIEGTLTWRRWPAALSLLAALLQRKICSRRRTGRLPPSFGHFMCCVLLCFSAPLCCGLSSDLDRTMFLSHSGGSRSLLLGSWLARSRRTWSRAWSGCLPFRPDLWSSPWWLYGAPAFW